MPLTPQQLAELQRLKELMRPQAEEFERRMRAIANAEKGSGQGVSLPTDKKAKGGLAEFLKDSAVKERLYHGTDKDFSVFNTPAYFSPDPEYASTGNISAGQNRGVMPVHLNLKNPARIDSTVKLTKQKINSLIKKGHDGAIGYINEYPFEYIAFHPHQIKSAIGNRGTYDPTNPDITKAKGGAIHLKRLGKFHDGEDPLAAHIPERANAKYALHPDKWESTFFSLTNKDPRKLNYYGPEHMDVPEGTLVGDMVHANRFYRAKTDEEKLKHAKAYRDSLKPYPIDLSGYRMPELLMPQKKDITKAKGGSVMGINVASDRKAGLQYADLIVDGHKTLESRNTDSLRPYVGKRVAIVRTGHGPAKAIGEVTIGEPMVVNKKKFRSLEHQHMVPEGSAFDISTPTKHLYPLSNPQRYEQEHDVGHGIVARKVMHKADGGAIPSQDVMRLAIGGQGPKNWLRGTVEQVIDPLKSTVGFMTPDRVAEQQRSIDAARRILGADAPRATLEQMEREIQQSHHVGAINQWIERNLGNYIKKQMATHDDPIRKLAEQGIIHMPTEQVGMNRYNAHPHRAHMDGTKLAQSPEAEAWEDAADIAMGRTKVKNIPANQREPWMDKADPETHLYYPRDEMHAHYLGFDHLVDILKQDLAEGRIRPEQLSKVSIEHAVRRAHEYDQERKKAMAQTALKATEGMPVHKEYPEGYKWIELTLPEKGEHLLTELDKRIIADRKDNPVSPEVMDRTLDLRAHEKLEEALKYEGDTMGHCVGGYTPDVASGKSRIFSLRDAKNEPHVTIEVEPVEKHPIGYGMKGAEEFPKDFRYEKGRIAPEQHQQIYQRAKQLFNPGSAKDVGSHRMDVFQQAADEVLGKPAPAIRQIKGKQNAKPKKDYIPYVQDFVKSGNWSDVGDLHNTDLHEVKDGEIPGFAQWMHIKAHGSVPKIPSGYYTPQELIRFGKESGLAQLHPSVHKKWIENLGLPPEDNKAHGGITHAHHLEIEERPL